MLCYVCHLPELWKRGMAWLEPWKRWLAKPKPWKKGVAGLGPWDGGMAGTTPWNKWQPVRFEEELRNLSKCWPLAKILKEF